MVDGFEEYTGNLTREEWDAVPALVSRLRASVSGTVSARVLADIAGWAGAHGQARVRRVVHVMRVTGEVPRLVADGRGYRVATSDDDVHLYLRSLEQRIASITAVRNALRRQIAEQPDLPFNA